MLAAPTQVQDEIVNREDISRLTNSLAGTSIVSSQDFSSSPPPLEGGRGGSSNSKRQSVSSSEGSEVSTPSSPSFTGSLSNSVALLVHNEKTAKELLAENHHLKRQELKELEWSQSFALHREWPRPSIKSPDELLISVKSVGLNPVDYKCIQYGFGIEEWPAVIGRDVAGVVEEVGSQVTSFKVGDRVSSRIALSKNDW